MKISSDSLDVVRVFLTAILFPESTLTEVGLFIRRPALDMRRIVRDLQSFIVLVHQGIIEEETGMPAVKLWIPRVLLEFLSDPARCGHLFVPMKDIQADVLMCALSWLPIASDEDLVSFLKDAGSPSKPAIRLALDIWCRDGVELVASDSLDTCLITPFEKLSKAGTWTKFIRAFETSNPTVVAAGIESALQNWPPK
ncbi:hypothetical protein BKA70DRAFT_752236 [Coprinopsis sp. MPI-PUGE-AT-0042]|nr:hypothetical protein BKA70DRAFT_752236 [Coprinopsis sp. MPI-PUGE-AT-0042]